MITRHDANTERRPTANIPTRTYNEWLLIAVSVGQLYRVNSAQWHECMTAAYKDLSTRIWALQDDAKVAIAKTGRAS